jgi:hypothetical protein
VQAEKTAARRSLACNESRGFYVQMRMIVINCVIRARWVDRGAAPMAGREGREDHAKGAKEFKKKSS